MSDTGPEDERLQHIYERLEELDPSQFEVLLVDSSQRHISAKNCPLVTWIGTLAGLSPAILQLDDVVYGPMGSCMACFANPLLCTLF